MILFSDQSDPDLMKSLALDVVYENESLLNNFKKESVEYIFINDGSDDGSAEWLKGSS